MIFTLHNSVNLHICESNQSVYTIEYQHTKTTQATIQYIYIYHADMFSVVLSSTCCAYHLLQSTFLATKKNRSTVVLFLLAQYSIVGVTYSVVLVLLVVVLLLFVVLLEV
jgi:hypothetical protein